jgi:signal transduction histidine kinase
MRTHNQVVNFAAVVGERTVPLDELGDQDRRHLLALFEHDVKGSRMLNPIYSGTDFLLAEFEFALQHDFGSVVMDGLDTIIPTLERHTFDTYVSRELSVEELQQQAATYVAKLQSDFPTLHCDLDNRILESETEPRMMHLRGDMLQSILDNCAANVVKICGTELKITLMKGLGEVYLIIKDNGQGFSQHHSFLPQMELADGTMLQPIEIIQGKSIWDKPGAVGTGIGLAEIRGYLRDNDGDLFAGNFLDNGAVAGGAVVATIATAPMWN